MKQYKVYIAGPMRGYPQWNFPAFDRARDVFKAAGFEVFSPADNDRALGFNENAMEQCAVFKSADPWVFLGWDLGKVNEADVIYLLKGWENSAGALLERHVAETLIGMGKKKRILTENGDIYLQVATLVVQLKTEAKAHVRRNAA
jgi:hypothetical protein